MVEQQNKKDKKTKSKTQTSKGDSQMKNDVDEMSDADDTPQMDAEGTMITSLCWVSRGFAKPLLEEANPDKDEKFLKKQMLKQSKLSK